MQRLEFKGRNDLALVADALGDERALPILMFPGGGQTRRSWQRTAEALADRGYRAIAVDLRGHGESAWATDGDYSIAAFAEDIASVVRALDKPPVVIGASIGGVAATIALGEHTQLLARALVLVDIVPRARTDGVEKIRSFMRTGLDGFESPEEAAKQVTAYLPHRPPRTVESLAANLRQGANGRWYWHWDPAFQQNSKTRRDEDMFTRMQSAASAIEIPILLVTGQRSEVVDESTAKSFLASLHNGRWVSVADAAHMVAGDANTPFSASILDFVESLPKH